MLRMGGKNGKWARKWPRNWVVVSCLSMLVLGPACPEEGVDFSVIIRNRSGETVKVLYKQQEQPRNLGSYGDGDQFAFGLIGPCTRGPLVALSLSGEEVDREPAGLCSGET